MTILAKEEILERIEEGELSIEPFDEDKVGPASIDLTLSDSFKIFKEDSVNILLIEEDIDYDDISKDVKESKVQLDPYEMCLGITKEKVKLPEDLCGWLEGRSRFARAGLMVHVTSSFIHPGCENKQVLEIVNMSPFKVSLEGGTRICQLILEEVKGKAKYKGKFSHQEDV